MKQRIDDAMVAPYRGPRYKIGDVVKLRIGSPTALVVDYFVKQKNDETLGDYENCVIIAFENGNEKLVPEERIYKV